MADANGGPVTNRQLASELKAIRWEMRALILVAVVLGNIVPVSTGDVVALAASLLS